MLDMSWGEMLIIGAVALIVIGPKDLPKALRTVGQGIGKIKRMAGEFQSQFNDAMREAELDQIRKEVEGMNQAASSVTTGFNPVQAIRDEVRGAIEAQPAATQAAGAAVAAAYQGTGVAAAETPGAAAAPAPFELALPELPPVGDPGPAFSPVQPEPAAAEGPAPATAAQNDERKP